MSVLDSELCQRIKDGDDTRFSELQAKYSSRVRSVCMREFERGQSGIHTKMSINYEHLVEDVSMIVWQDLYKNILKGVRFDDEDSFIKLLTRVTQNKTRDKKNESIKNRKDGLIKGASNNFQSKDQEGVDFDFSIPSDSFLCDEDDDTEEQFIELLSGQLDAKERVVLQLMEESSKSAKKLTQEDMADILGVSDRTVRNRI
ncbi:MAG: sigma-70 family RNA polymerase sigma factor, partial [Candidatus Thiodiazotropha sp.]|nr:sigma-70 family RNA polymerase sigma factor [Candidatus Thiodiazotropha sp.]